MLTAAITQGACCQRSAVIQWQGGRRTHTWFPVGTGSGMYDFIHLDSTWATKQNYDSNTRSWKTCPSSMWSIRQNITGLDGNGHRSLCPGSAWNIIGFLPQQPRTVLLTGALFPQELSCLQYTCKFSVSKFLPYACQKWQSENKSHDHVQPPSLRAHYDVVVNGTKYTCSTHISYRCSQHTPQRQKVFPFVTREAAIQPAGYQQELMSAWQSISSQYQLQFKTTLRIITWQFNSLQMYANLQWLLKKSATESEPESSSSWSDALITGQPSHRDNLIIIDYNLISNKILHAEVGISSCLVFLGSTHCPVM